MSDISVSASGGSREPMFSPSSLPKGGGTVAAAAGMLAIGGADGAAGWTLPLPLPVGRELMPALSLTYRSSAGNGAFGAGWQCAPPIIRRMDRVGIPRYSSDDRWIGPDGEEILPDQGAARVVEHLPFSSRPAPHVVTSWVPRSGGRDQRLEHWCEQASVGSPGFWLQYHADGSLTLFGWSASARVAVPGEPQQVACWYAEETVSALGEHVVYRYRAEDGSGCDAHELAMHQHIADTYLVAVHAMNATPSAALLIPRQAFAANDFMTVMQLDYGERDVALESPPAFDVDTPWALRQDCFSSWRWGFDKRTRRLCHGALLWHRTHMLDGRDDPTPHLVSRLQLRYEVSGIASLLVAAQQVAYEPEGTPSLQPPVEFEWCRPGSAQPGWAPLSALDGFSAPRWQMADLFGDGLPGLLYQDACAWWYRAPQRGEGGDDALTWGAAQRLPCMPGPVMGKLADLDGDGRPHWLVNLPGLRGSFTLAPDGQWQDFVAADAVPSELAYDKVQFVDLRGAGRHDLVMIGPRSVRLHPRGHRMGWQAAIDLRPGNHLPLPGSEHRLVGFADMAGSGLQQLVEVTGDGVSYWPSDGCGGFANPVRMTGVTLDGFNAARVLLGDTDGSGTCDILYVEAQRIRVFVNHSGNAFVEGPPIPAPNGVTFDATCKLQLVDLRGQGTADLLLTVPHMQPFSLAYRFNDRRPWLLSEVCGNTGSRTVFDYRSSAQAWLDEKRALQRQGRVACSRLPFPVHTLCKVTVVDDINGLRTVSGLSYRGGVWDGVEREFRGFGQVIQTDTLSDAQGAAAERSPPAQVRRWFFSGLEAHDHALVQGLDNQGEAERAFALRPVRFTRWVGDREEPFEPTAAARDWLLRALKGAEIRHEVHGLDDSELAAQPYDIRRQRWQIRAYETARADRPAALVTAVETLKFDIERIVADPQVSQTLVLAQDRQGHVLQQVQVRYPRRPAVPTSAYPGTLPEGLLADSRDPQQDSLWLELSRHRVCHLQDGHDHRCGLLDSTRTDVLALSARAVPQEGFCVESLLAPHSPLQDLSRATLAHYQRSQWCDEQGAPSERPVRQALVAYLETARLESVTLASLEPLLREQALAHWRTEGGYRSAMLAEDGKQVYVSRHTLVSYLGEQQFYRPATLRQHELLGEVRFGWSAHAVQRTSTIDAAGARTWLRYDWRFFLPVLLLDPNDNQYEVDLDAWGQVLRTRFQGLENGKLTGYRSGKAFTVPSSMDGFLALQGGDVPVATAHRLVRDSWMPWARDDQGRPLSTRRGELALRRQCEAAGLAAVDLREGCQPPHIISLQTDRYDGDPAQQLCLSVTHSDGAGRPLQHAVLSAPGEALQRAPDGTLRRDAEGNAILRPVARRWAVTGKTEYDNKGQPVRTWLPYYLDDWRVLQGHAAVDALHGDTRLYDARGREHRVLTATGRERRTHYYPWFTVAEDENDTA